MDSRPCDRCCEPVGWSKLRPFPFAFRMNDAWVQYFGCATCLREEKVRHNITRIKLLGDRGNIYKGENVWLIRKVLTYLQ